MGKKLVRKQDVGIKRVFDLDVKYNHNFVADDTVVHNCTEKGAQRFFAASKPKSIVDIAALTSIYRPGPLAADVDKIYNEAKANPDAVVYDHPNLKKVLESTYGTIVFQEQIMLIAERVAGLPLDECDSFRRTLTKRSMAKKDSAMAEFEALKDRFVEGCMEHSGLSKGKATELFDKLRFFSGYGFNKTCHYHTLIKTYTSEGSRSIIKTLDEVQPGEFIDSCDEKTGRQIRIPVHAVHDHGELPLFEIELDSGQTVVCTLDHKFRVQDGRMLPVWQIMNENLDMVVCSAPSRSDDELRMPSMKKAA